jgi:hypothetical protein
MASCSFFTAFSWISPCAGRDSAVRKQEGKPPAAWIVGAGEVLHFDGWARRRTRGSLISAEEASMIRSVFLAVAVGLTALVMPAPSQAQPAPPLSRLQIIAVYSPQGGVELIADNQFLTANDHGGAFIQFATDEVGYATNQIATFNGVRATQYASQPLYWSGTNIIAGWRRYWQVNGNFTSGQIRYQATSINYPFNTMSDWLQVR